MNRNSQYLPDFEFKFSEEDLENISKQLSSEEEIIFEEILKLEKDADNKTDLMKDLLEAAKIGTMQYLDAMTDTGESFDRLKDPDNVRKHNEEEIIRRAHSANPNESREPRTMQEAFYEPFDKNVSGSTSGMSAKGAKLFERHKKAYSQRTKSVTETSVGKTSHYRSDESVNFESLSGLRGYRVGAVVSMYSTEEIKTMYANETEKRGTIKDTSGWLKEKNFEKFDEALMKEYGFKTRSAAARWRKDNHLTIHESPDGMYLVPTDVHDAVSHAGYRSKMKALLEGKITKEELNSYIIKEKIEYVKHEAYTRGVRAIKGVGLTAIKDVLKCSIVVICENTYTEFKEKSEERFIDRMIRILKKCWKHVKAKCAHIIKNILENIQGSLLSEILTTINDVIIDFFCKTFKNIFRIVRQMFDSIKRAFKIITSKDKSISFGERFFEASKVLSAGIVGLVGFSLNELIEKGLTSIGIPFASFIAECLSGLFAGIMSAIVMMLFDKLKKQFISQSTATRQLQLESRYLCIHSAQVDISSLIIDMKMLDTYNFIGQIFASMNDIYKHIESEKQNGEKLTRVLVGEAIVQKERNADLEALKRKYIEDTNF